MEYLPNRLTPLYSKIYYKEENYLKVKTAVFKYITPPIVKVEYVGMLVYLVYLYIFIFSRSHILNSCHVLPMWLGYPSFYDFTSFISSASRVLILTQYKSFFSTYTILFIKSVILALSSLSLSLKNLVSKLLIRGVLHPGLI